MHIKTIILAAGQGTRMRSRVPKILHRIGGRPLLEHVYELSKALTEDVCVIFGHGAEMVHERLAHLEANWVEQSEQLGTGHAVMQVAPAVRDDETVLILYGDVPLLKIETARTLLNLVEDDALGLLSVELADPHGYGRIVRDIDGRVVKIVEEKDASEYQKTIREVNTGILALNGGKLKNWLARLDNENAQNEYYLTDIIEMAVDDGVEIRTCHPMDEDEVLGVNNRQQLAHLERAYQHRNAERLMLGGITLMDPARFDLRGEILDHGQDVEIDVNVILEGRITLGSNVTVGPNTLIKDSNIGDGVEILANCVIEGAEIGPGSRIGPFARLRPDSVLATTTHVGNFVEIKKSSVGEGSKINHLSYIGDSRIGSNVNIGAGTITCNYDGANKFETVIEDGAFIGSDTQLVAPVKVGKNATIGAGSTITKDAPDATLTLSRSKQVSAKGWQRPGKKGG